MTRWPTRRLPAVEPPAWVRSFDPDAWRDPEDDERFASVEMPPGMGSMVDWRARGRWQAAVNVWYRAHPGSDHRLDELIARRAARLATLRRSRW